MEAGGAATRALRVLLQALQLEEVHYVADLARLPMLLLAGCGSTTERACPRRSVATPAPTSHLAAASSPYAGNWTYRATITCRGQQLRPYPADIGKTEAAVGVTIASNGTFTAPGGGQGAIGSSHRHRFPFPRRRSAAAADRLGALEAAAINGHVATTARPCRARQT